MKRCSTSLIIREMHIKTTTRYKAYLLECLKLKTFLKCTKDVEQPELSYITGGNVKWWTTLQNILTVPQMIKHRITYHMTQWFYSRIYAQEMKTYVHMKTCIWMFIIASSIKQEVEATQMSSNRWIDKQDCGISI